MGSSSVQSHCINEDATNELAARFQSVCERHWIGGCGVESKPAAVFGWRTWPGVSVSEGAVLLSINDEPALLLRFEPDTFNSTCTKTRQARLHWLIGSASAWTLEARANLCKELLAVLNASGWKLVALRLLGHNPPAAEVFQRAGFRMMIGNAWFYRWPGTPPPVSRLPSGIDVDFRDLKRHPFFGAELDEAISIAQESIFPDRFSMDSHIDPELAGHRFLTIARNALCGEIADYAGIARMGSKIQAIVFFGVTAAKRKDAFPIAGNWITAIAGHSVRARGMTYSLTAECINRLPEGKAYWTCACALDHFQSLRVANRLGFRCGAIAYDLHWWRKDAGLEEVDGIANSGDRK